MLYGDWELKGGTFTISKKDWIDQKFARTVTFLKYVDLFPVKGVAILHLEHKLTLFIIRTYPIYQIKSIIRLLKFCML